LALCQLAPVISDDAKPRTIKQKLHDIWAATKTKPQELIDHPESPPHFVWIWEWFFDFPSPVTWSEINAWSTRSGIEPARWEGELLIRLDNLRK